MQHEQESARRKVSGMRLALEVRMSMITNSSRERHREGLGESEDCRPC